MRSAPAHRQEHVEFVILEVLEFGRVMTTQEVTKATKKRLELESVDLERAAKRETETKIDQIIANALQAKRNLCGQGLIERVNRGEFRITAKGKEHLVNWRNELAELRKLLDEIAPDAEWD